MSKKVCSKPLDDIQNIILEILARPLGMSGLQLLQHIAILVGRAQDQPQVGAKTIQYTSIEEYLAKLRSECAHEARLILAELADKGYPKTKPSVFQSNLSWVEADMLELLARNLQLSHGQFEAMMPQFVTEMRNWLARYLGLQAGRLPQEKVPSVIRVGLPLAWLDSPDALKAYAGVRK